MSRTSAESEARKALNRLRRAAEKALRELETLEGALRHAEGEEFPEADYRALAEKVEAIRSFTEDEGRRLQAKILHTGGLEPGRVRRG